MEQMRITPALALLASALGLMLSGPSASAGASTGQAPASSSQAAEQIMSRCQRLVGNASAQCTYDAIGAAGLPPEFGILRACGSASDTESRKSCLWAGLLFLRDQPLAARLRGNSSEEDRFQLSVLYHSCHAIPLTNERRDCYDWLAEHLRVVDLSKPGGARYQAIQSSCAAGAVSLLKKIQRELEGSWVDIRNEDEYNACVEAQIGPPASSARIELAQASGAARNLRPAEIVSGAGQTALTESAAGSAAGKN